MPVVVRPIGLPELVENLEKHLVAAVKRHGESPELLSALTTAGAIRVVVQKRFK